MITRGEFLDLVAGGSGAKLARLMGFSRQAAQEWKGSDKPLPLERVPRAAELLGKRPEEIRPDFDWSVLRQPVKEEEAA